MTTEIPKRRNKCSNCSEKVMWKAGADNKFFLVDIPSQTIHKCPKRLKFIPSKK